MEPQQEQQEQQVVYNSTEPAENIKEKETAVSLNKESPVVSVESVANKFYFQPFYKKLNLLGGL